MTLEEIKKAVGKMNDDKKFHADEPADQAGLVLLAAAVVGPKVRAIARFTGLPQKTVSQFVTRLRCNGIFTRNKIRADWADPKEGGIAFCCDVLVATGMLERAR